MNKERIFIPTNVEYDGEIDKLVDSLINKNEECECNVSDEEVKEFMEHFGIEYINKKD